MRLHLFEFEDQPWFPDVIRVGGTDYLRYLLIATKVYQPCIQLLNDVLSQTGVNKLVDLCSGGGVPAHRPGIRTGGGTQRVLAECDHGLERPSGP